MSVGECVFFAQQLVDGSVLTAVSIGILGLALGWVIRDIDLSEDGA